jgi:chemotaxis protein CheD
MVDPKSTSLKSEASTTHDACGGDRRIYFDQRLKSLVVSVCQGQFYVSSSPYEVLSTVLGSCIAVCMRDPVAGCGGMNHFLLPNQAERQNEYPSASLRYGSYSIERLTNALLSRGALRERLEIKVFGGANVLNRSGNYGHSNADFVEAYLAREGLKIVARSLRGNSARRIRYYPASGRAQVSEVQGDTPSAIAADESRLASRLQLSDAKSRVEIFDPKIRIKG